MTQRSLRIENAPGTALLQIAWDGGGEMPDVLKGLFTSASEAQLAIAAWSAGKDRNVAWRDTTLQSKEDEVAKRGPGRPTKQIESI